MSDEIKELTIKANLIESDKIVGTVEKKFALIESQETEEDKESRTLDDTITEFLQEIETEVREKKLEIKNKEKFYTDSVMSLILFFIKPKADAATLKVPVQLLKEKKVEEEDNGKPTNN